MPMIIRARAESWDIVLCKAESRCFTCIVSEFIPRLYGHVARHPEVDPAHGGVSVRDNHRWRGPGGRPQSSRIEQLGGWCHKGLRTGRRPAWSLT